MTAGASSAMFMAQASEVVTGLNGSENRSFKIRLLYKKTVYSDRGSFAKRLNAEVIRRE
ncbi:hypothetical protein GCM10027217_42610 [Pseudomaricurvus hydrocarbonicus]